MATTTLKGLSNQVLLVILDGFGMRENTHKNAITAAKKTNLDYLFSHFPYREIEGGGELVGLPKGVVGNSEVGHINIGAGKAVRQDLVRINEAISNGSFSNMEELKNFIDQVKQGTKRVHLMGLLSDGGVHSHIEHLKEIIKVISKEDDLQIFLHAYMDGRDTPKDKGLQYLEEIQQEKGFVFASMQGRSIGMDRDRRWEKIEQAYNCFVGKGKLSKEDPKTYLKSQYDQGIFDEFIEPTLFTEEGRFNSGDGVFFFNFRPDRAKQISLALNDPQFDEFETPVKIGPFLCMTPYVEEELPELPILFDKEKVKGTLAEYLSQKNVRQLKIAETEKYAHVTYFFNGGEEKPFDGEHRILVNSPRDVATYDLKPEMSAQEVTDNLLKELDDSSYGFYVVNYANSDMVGHTGNFEAAVKAIECLDRCVKRLMEKCREKKIVMLLSADHGNSDQMAYPDGSAHTSHTGSKVPFVAFHPELEGVNLATSTADGALKDISPTILYTLGLEIPSQMQGQPLFK